MTEVRPRWGSDTPNPLVRRLTAVHDLADEDLGALERLCVSPRHVGAGRDIIALGERPIAAHLVLDGFALRYKMLPDGGRQIVGILLPGDFCDLHAAVLAQMDHSIAALTDCAVVDISPAEVRALTEEHPRIARALRWATLVDQGTLREWLANLGRRTAALRLAHFLCELRLRLGAIGLADADGYDLPLTQFDVADALGLTHVHVNRSLRALREAKLITLRKRRLTIWDVSRLEAFCGFDPVYLHITPGEVA